MRSTPPRFLALASLALLVAGPASAADDACPPPARRAGAVLAGTAEPTGLPVAAVYALDQRLLDAGVLRASIETLVGSRPGPQLGSVCVGVVVETESGIRNLARGRLFAPEGQTRELFRWGTVVDLPADASQVLIVAEDPLSGRWGLAVAEEEDFVRGPGPSAAPLQGGGWIEIDPSAAPGGAPPSPPAVPGAPAPAPGVPPPSSPPPSSPSPSSPSPYAPPIAKPEVRGKIVRIVPPRDQPVSGRTRFDALVTTEAVDKVAFFVDEEPAGDDGLRPFVVTVDLGSPARERTVKAVAYDKGGRPLGDDTLVVNRRDDPFRVRITAWSLDAEAARARLEATVSVPRERKLTQVALFRNDTLLATLPAPPYRFDVPLADPAPEDFLRVAATLDDGSSIDDVVLLAAPGAVEEVEVNLVEVHAVVTDASGEAISSLGQDDFTVTLDGRPQPIQSFAHADDVPLVLGLVVDTSGSMELLMTDTKKAAAKFVGSTMRAGDRAFLVDFDQRPRLRQASTDDVGILFRSLGGLIAGGTTALYDAVVYAMLQFETEPGRKALVILSDGDDHDSRYGPKQCVELGEKLGVPVYVIGLGALDDLRRIYPKGELRKLTGDTGGRLFFVDTFADLDAAYAQIRAELRSQYTLGFATPRELTPEERRKVAVRVSRPGLGARVVVGAKPGA